MDRVRWAFGGWSAAVFLFLYGPIVVLGVWSFNASPYSTQWSGFSTKWYQAFWYRSLSDLHDAVPPADAGWRHAWATVTDQLGAARADEFRVTLDAPRVWGQIPGFVDGTENSLIVGVCATAASVALGTAGAWATFKYKYPLHRTLATLITVPMIVPEIIMGVGLLSLYSIAAGGIGRVHLQINPLLAVVLAHVTFSFPYVMVTLQARLAGIDPALEEAAMDLGATPWRAFRKVIVPYLMPALISGTLMAFTLSLDDFIVTYFVKDASSQTLPIYIYGAVKGPPPMLHVVATLMIAATVLLVVLSEGIKRFSR